MKHCGITATFLVLLAAGALLLQRSPAQALEPTFDSAAANNRLNQSIDRGFAWLRKAIRRDGSVSTDEFGEADLACTAMTGLAFLSEGSTPNSGRYSKDCQRVLHAVLRLSRERLDRELGVSLVQRKIGRNADLFIATLFLSEAFGEAPYDQEQIRTVLRRLIDRICETQGPDGTWGDDSWAPVLGTVLGWECLRSSYSAGFRIDASAELVANALHRQLIKQAGAVKSDGWMHAFYKETASLRVLYSTQFRNEPIFDEAVVRLLTMTRKERRTFEQAGGEEYLAFYLVSECLLKEPKPNWKEWQPLVSEGLMQQQNGDGSWTGHHCITNRTFCTAAALLTLVAPKLSLPISDL